jgi:tRNA1(Val) A37 N6-methylase TrmN6
MTDHPSFSDADLTQDGFLDGRVQILQPKSGYRAGVDPVLLAASVNVRSGQSVLELGCGAGQALLCLNHRVEGLRLSGVELQLPYADLARRNAALNDATVDVHCADLAALPDVLRQQSFDHVIANPPYFRAGAHSQARDAGRRTALGEATPLEDWISNAAKRLKPRGYLHMIQKGDRLADVLTACSGRLGSLEVLPLAARQGRRAELVILRARKEGRAAFRLHSPCILHQGVRHDQDGEDMRPEIRAVLRDGAAIGWPAG